MSIVATFIAVQIMSFADSIISNTLVKNNYTAESIMQDDFTKIDFYPITENNGGIQVINKNLDVVFSNGLNILGNGTLTTEEFTDFLVFSKSVGFPYSIDVQYNATEEFWLIVTFPTSIRFDFAFTYNKEIASKDMQNIFGLIVAVVLLYLIMLTICAAVYSKLTAIRFTSPLQKLIEGTQGLRNGNYNTRVRLNLKNEFAELQDTFNAMAEQIGNEISLRHQSEENRKKLILDISHDLKNPLASILGYSELCLKKISASNEELINKYINQIQHL
jgi:signal transduction histidine kinase